MTDGRQSQPPSDQAPHPIPEDAAIVAVPRRPAMPQPFHLEPKDRHRLLIHVHSVVADLSLHHRLQPLPQFGDAISGHPMGPSASPHSVGVPEELSYAAKDPARTFPCQRFDAALAGGYA